MSDRPTIRALQWLSGSSAILIPWLVLSIPLSNFDFSPFIAALNRMAFYVCGLTAGYKLIVRKNNIEFEWPLFVLVLLFISFATGIRNVSLVSDMYEYASDILMLFSAIALLGPARSPITEKSGKFIAWCLVAYSLDVIWQFVYKVDMLGIEPYGEVRNWGLFILGAPTFGVFAVSMFFAPWFYLNIPNKLFAYSIVIPAIFMANDRAPVLQLLACLIFGIFFIKRKLLVTSLVAGSIAVLTILLVFLDLMPFRIKLLLDFIAWAVQNPNSAFQLQGGDETSKLFSVYDYINTWSTIVNNWFSVGNYENVIYGSGWGAARDTLQYVAGVSRPHSVILELVVTFGFSSVIFIFALNRLIKKYRVNSLLVMPFFMPFLFFSVYSFNLFILFVASWAMMKERASRNSSSNLLKEHVS